MALTLEQIKKNKPKNKASSSENKEQSLNKRAMFMPWEDIVDNSTNDIEIPKNKLVDKKELKPEISKPPIVVEQSQTKKHKSVTNREQTGNKSVTKTSSKQDFNDLPSSHYTYSALSGLRKQIVNIIYESSKSKIEKVSDPLTIDYLFSNLETSKGTIKTSLKRMVKDKFISRVDYKNGRAGWAIYKLNSFLYSDIVNNKHIEENKELKSVTNREQAIHNNHDFIEDEIPKSWSRIDIPPVLQERGFSGSHIKQIYNKCSKVFSAEDVQESLNNYAYDLQSETLKIKTSVISFFMGILIKNKTQYVSETYMFEKNKELKSYLLKIEELKKAEKDIEEITKLKLFEAWEETLSKEQKLTMVQEQSFARIGSPTYKLLLKKYWEANFK